MIMDIRREIRGITKIDGDERTLLRLMNICGHKRIKTWRDPRGKESCLYIYSDEFDRVNKIVKKCMFEVKLTDQISLRQKVKANRKRLSVLFGMILFAIYIYIESLYIWHIDVEGCGNYTEEEVLNVIDNYYPCLGKKKKTIDADELEKIVSDHLADVCWASCNINGTKLTVKLSESVDIFTDDTPDGPCNLVSSMDCTVYSIVTSMGTPVVMTGDDVKKGDQLISGMVNICNDDSEVVDTRYVTAQGQIIGQCSIPYHDEIQTKHYNKHEIDTTTDLVGIMVRKKFFSLHGNEKKDYSTVSNTDTEQREYWLHVGNFYFPFAVLISQSHVFDVESREYTEDELKALAEQHIVTYIGKLQEKGVQIVQKNVIITNGVDKVIADGDIVVRMPVGVPEMISHVGAEN